LLDEETIMHTARIIIEILIAIAFAIILWKVFIRKN